MHLDNTPCLLHPPLHNELLFVTHKYPPSTGGMQKQSFELIAYAQRQMGVKTILYQSKYPKIFFLLSVTLRAFVTVLLDRKIRLVHANDGLMALLLTPLLLIKRVKVCATVHGLDVVFNLSIYQWWVKKYLPKFDFLIAVSQATQKECLAVGVPEDKVHFIPNAVELPPPVKKDPAFLDWLHDVHKIDLTDRLILTSVGRPVPRKGFGWFAKNVLPHLPNACYLVAGTAMEQRGFIFFLKKLLPASIFEKLCKMLGVPLDAVVLSQIAKTNSQLVLLGKIPQPTLHQMYLHTDLFLMPNLHVKGDFEGFGLVALEAGILGAVCLAANVDGIPSAIQDGQNGFLLESGAPEEWVKKIQSLSHKKTRKEAQEKFKSYFSQQPITWEEIGQQYLLLFEKKRA